MAVEFDRAKIRHRLTFYALPLTGYAICVALLYSLAISHVGERSWVSYVAVAILLITSVSFLEYVRWAGILGRALRRRGNAFAVNKLGVVDNATDYAFGQLAWNEIEKMYPWSWTTRLLGNRWKQMPVICTERGIVIVLKDNADLRARVQNKSWIRRSAFEAEFAQGRRWFFVPEAVLPVTASDLMKQINEFYMTQVRAAAAGS